MLLDVAKHLYNICWSNIRYDKTTASTRQQLGNDDVITATQVQIYADIGEGRVKWAL